MALDFSKVNDRISAFNKNSQPTEKIDYTTIFWRPQEGKQVVRLVPSVVDPTYPFTEMQFHYNFDFPIPALSNFGKQDPVEEFVKELRKLGGDDNFDEARKYSPKTRILAPVIVRGEEDKGVRLWNFGITIYDSLLKLAKDEDIGDYTDPINGWDMVVEMTPKNAQSPYPKTEIRIKPKQTPLSDDNTSVETWLKEQPKPLEVYKAYDYEFVKKQLKKATLGTSEDSNIDTSLPESLGQQKTDFTLETATAGNKDTVSKFDDLFES